jgi:uncharacterized protein (TIGR02246 family)
MMKVRRTVALVGLAISFALPTFSEQKETVDPQIVLQLHAIAKKTDEAFLRADAAAVASFFTEDAVLVNDTGPIYGRQAIEKYYADMFQYLHFFNHQTTYDPTSPHPIGTDGNGVWENGEWSSTIAPQGEDCGPHEIRGYFASVSVREGNSWKVRMVSYNLTPAPHATPSHTTAP